jgi:hypothetical protein
MLVTLFCREILFARYHARYPEWDTTRQNYPWWYTTGQNRPPRTKVTFHGVLSTLCLIGITWAQLKIINSGYTHSAGTQLVMASFLFYASVDIVMGQLAVIWRGQNHARKPDAETRPA